MEENNTISNIQNEILFVGAVYKKPDLYVEYGRFIKSKYDFYDDATRFFYDNLELMFKTFSQTVDEFKVNTFMSEDTERFKLYKKYGGWKLIKSWIEISHLDDFKNYLETIKKFSLLREYDRKGYDVARIMNHPKFFTLTANDIYKIIRSGVDKISTVILTNDESIVINKELSNKPKNWLLKPQMGLEMPFKLLNKMYRGFRLSKIFALGLLSNEGKSRLAISMACYITFVKKEKVIFLANEMEEDDFKSCVIATVINNKWFKELHGIDIDVKEEEVVLGLYRDVNGNLLQREIDETTGEFLESEDNYVNRVYNLSETFRKVLAITEWVENQMEGRLFFKCIITDYSDPNIEFEVRKHKLVHGCNYVFYDTLKCYKDENWSVLKQTTTMFNALAIELKIYAWLSIQLTDDSVFTDIFSFSSNNIANAKQLKHVLDYLVLGKRLPKEDYNKYSYIPNEFWGEEPSPQGLDVKKTYYAFKPDKNRGGSKDKIPLAEVDLDLNTWYEVGYLIKKSK